MNIIETHHLTKTYAGFTAVSNVDLHVPKGTVYGFLGPNGAGKSTTMKMFLGLTKPTSGDFVIDEKKYPQDRIRILEISRGQDRNSEKSRFFHRSACILRQSYRRRESGYCTQNLRASQVGGG